VRVVYTSAARLAAVVRVMYTTVAGVVTVVHQTIIHSSLYVLARCITQRHTTGVSPNFS
jgi:hypothetical protein